MRSYLMVTILTTFTFIACAQKGNEESTSYRVIISSDFPPLDVIPGGAGYGPAEKRSDQDDMQSMVRFLSYTNDPDKPNQESWGGQYEQRDPAKDHWYDGPGATSVSKWLADIQKDFATRADWMLPE